METWRLSLIALENGNRQGACIHGGLALSRLGDTLLNNIKQGIPTKFQYFTYLLISEEAIEKEVLSVGLVYRQLKIFKMGEERLLRGQK